MLFSSPPADTFCIRNDSREEPECLTPQTCGPASLGRQNREVLLLVILRICLGLHMYVYPSVYLGCLKTVLTYTLILLQIGT